MEAVAALEVEEDNEKEGTDWAEIADSPSLSAVQPDLTKRLRLSLQRPASRSAFIKVLGSLGDPFTLVKTEVNALLKN